MHTSVKLNTPCEFINVTPLNPLISKCQIKVCYVGEQPNRNKSIITKDVARELANSLPGSPIVGCFNETKDDFEEHNEEISISNGEIRIKDGTRPYGFVDLGAKCWFQKFMDDGQNEREYLMTEGYLWTGQYPEVRKVIEQGKGQSMELDGNSLDAQWTKDSNGKPQFFIINEAIISKLCILGDDVEPCFEGANITGVQFSFADDFKQQLFSMMTELKELLSKGGTQVFTTYAVKVGDSLWTALYSFMQKNNYASIDAVLQDGEHTFAVMKDNDDKAYSLDFSVAEDGAITLAENAVKMENYTPAKKPQFALEDVKNFEINFKKNEGKEDKSDSSNSDNKSEGDKEDSSSAEGDKDPDDKDPDKDNKDGKKKTSYSLEEYTELASKYAALESKYNELVAEKATLESQIKDLNEFKLNTERAQKQNMIKNEFYMLSDEDKKDVIDHIDEYSLNEIEEKLSVICVRNKVSFAALDDDNQHRDPTTYNLGGELFQDESTPAWVKAVLENEKANKL